MSDNKHNNSGSNERDIAPDDVYGQLSKGMTQTIKEIGKTDSYKGKPEKVFGLFDADPTTATLITGAYNTAAVVLQDLIRPKTYKLAEKFAVDHLKQDGDRASQIAALTTFGVSAGLKSAGYIATIYKTMQGQHAELLTLSHKISPVLTELKGKHSVAALTSVSLDDNKMIKSHLKRLAKIAHNQNVGNVIELVSNAGLSLALDFKIPYEVAQGTKGEELGKLVKKTAFAKRPPKVEHAEDENPHTAGLKAMASTIFAPLGQLFKSNNSKKLQESLSGYSALEMVLELEDQVTNNPKVNTVYPPRSKTGCPLEEYIVKIIIQQQKDLADFDADESEVRDALKEDLQLVAKPMAAAIRNGQISALSLVRLIGEGHVIKGHGRVVASAEEVEAQIERMSEHKTEQKVHQDPKDFYASSSFSKEELKAALKALTGEEKHIFASWFSDAVLEDAGISASEVKAIRAETLQSYDRDLLDAFHGIAAKSDADLKSEGLASSEIREVRKAQDYLLRNGDKGIEQLKDGPANAHGVEKIIVNLAVRQIEGDREYLGRLLEKGREGPSANDNQPAANDRGEPISHAERLRDKAKPAAASNDDSRAPRAVPLSHLERAKAEQGALTLGERHHS